MPIRTPPARSGGRRGRSDHRRRAPAYISPRAGRPRSEAGAERARRGPCGARCAGGSAGRCSARTLASSSGAERLEAVVVDLDLREGAGDRLEERSLHIGQAAIGRNCCRDAPRHLDDLFGLMLAAAHVVSASYMSHRNPSTRLPITAISQRMIGGLAASLICSRRASVHARGGGRLGRAVSGAGVRGVGVVRPG